MAIDDIQNAFGVLRESLGPGVTGDRPNLLVSFDEINDLTGLPQLRGSKIRCLSAADRKRRYGPGHRKAAK